MIVWADVLGIASTLSAVPSAAQTAILAYVNDTIAPGKLGVEGSSRLHLARCYLAAHLGTMTNRAGAGASGPVTMEQEGPVMRQFAPGTAAIDFKETVYGRRYVEIVRTSKARAPFIP